ncbi:MULTISPECIES: NACHT domain-containing protein [unclassified Leifsonia]|nr:MULTISPECIES: hypothetical protein [unclassified Leifsonia]
MDYNLDSLGPRNFEHLTQALLARKIGPKLSVFGDGPDGGREAIWNGEAPSFGRSNDWNGYGVLQAKFKVHTSDVSANLTWLKSVVRKEISEWTRPDSKRYEKPEYLLFVTNVRLSSVPGAGKDDIRAELSRLVSEADLPIKEVQLWDYHELITQLDDAEDIRRRYAAFLTPGDVIAAMLSQVDDTERTLGEALTGYTARLLIDENIINLTQAGTSGDGRVTMGDVFVDLPASLPPQPWATVDTSESDDLADSVTDDEDDEDVDPSEYFDIAETDRERARERSGIVTYLVNEFNRGADAIGGDRRSSNRTVLVGGPGQGKSTVTQWLAQLFRAEFLRGSSVEVADVRDTAARVEARRQKLGLPEIRARRWPVRIVLSELADHLAESPKDSLLHYVASRVSDRSSVPVDSMMVRRWLQRYPWLLLIDGLDEVPASSNREQVMTAIRDFFIDVAGLGADVAAVATTRPQGYGEEFSPNEYQHFELSALTVTEAISYAEGLVSLRMGEGTTNAEKVMERLRRASREEHTSRLFESPLQVTILEVLLEKLGKAPNDRSRLYSAYYNVISEREQEKSGELSELVQRYESDVVYLHRRIGFELQTRGAAVGETTSSLTIDEFNLFLTERFREQGHEPVEAAALVDDFTRLVTDRLVFLAKLQADRIGFELRSLQEFMAAEYLVNLPETDVIGEIEARARTPYWRNVVLFAIGSVFAHKEHLRAEIVLSCERLNIDDKTTQLMLPGADLAIDILRDGSCLSMPRYARGLVQNALRALSQARSVDVRQLLFLASTDYASLLWDELESVNAMSAVHSINRVALLAMIRSEHADRADKAMRRIFDEADPHLRAALIEWAWDTWDSGMGEVVGNCFLTAPPTMFYEERARLGTRSILRSHETPSPEWMRNLSVLSGANIRDRPDFGSPRSKESAVTVFFYPLGGNTEAWQWLAGIESDDYEWRASIEIAKFAANPSSSSLADALEAFSASDNDSAPQVTPWPFVACAQYADRIAATTSTSRTTALLQLAAASRRGELGEVDHWYAAQNEWGAVFPVTEAFVSSLAKSPSGTPLWPFVPGEGYAHEGFTFLAGTPTDAAELDQQVRIVRAFAARGTAEQALGHVAVFLASLIASARLEDPTLLTPELRNELFELVSPIAADSVLGPHWLPWINLAEPSHDRPSGDLIRSLGARDWYSRYMDEAHADFLLGRLDEATEAAGALRLALHSKPSLIVTCERAVLKSAMASRPDLSYGIVAEACAVVDSSLEALWSGSLDSHLRAIACSDDRVFGAMWFLRVLDDDELPNGVHIAARTSFVAADANPRIAERMYEVAERLRLE